MSASTRNRLGMLVLAVGTVTACLPARQARVSPLVSAAAAPAALLQITTDSGVPYGGTMLPLHVTLRTGDDFVAVPADSVYWESSLPARAWITRDGIANLDATGPVVITARY